MHNWETPPCCGAKQSVQVWDFKSDGEPWVNRMCVNCETHWYGPEYDVLPYNKHMWNAMMEARL